VVVRVSFTVRGLPAPQGSKRHRGRGVMVEMAGQKLKDWRSDVKNAAYLAMGDAGRFCAEQSGIHPFDGPVGVSVCFTLPKPKSAPKTRRTWPHKRPDLDKLLRSTLDGLTGEVFADDAQVIEIHSAKCYPGEGALGAGDVPGAFIEVWQIGEDDV
jgi:Holliday junction resolvase RusA-like endonuclease